MPEPHTPLTPANEKRPRASGPARPQAAAAPAPPDTNPVQTQAAAPAPASPPVDEHELALDTKILLAAVPDLLAIVVDKSVRYINEAGVKMLGAVDQAAVVGIKIDSIIDLRTVYALMLKRQEGRQHGDEWIKSRVARINGTEIDAHIRIMPLDAPRTLGVVARTIDAPMIVIDDSSIAAHAADGVKQLVANLAHELRTPLNAIIGFSEVIAHQMFGEINARYRGYAGDINESGQHLLRIINDILDYAKLDAGQMVLHPQRANLHDIVASSLRLVSGQAEQAGVRLLNQVPEDGMPVTLDVTKIKQVLVNILGNAVKFTPRGGSVSIGLKLAERGKFTINVIDTGIGMSREEAAEAMLPFHQLRQRTDDRQIGTGLGLPIAKAIVTLHSGDLRITSTPKQGTTVEITLPTEPMPRNAIS